MPVTPNHLKQVMRRYATGVMVLTVPDGDNYHAVTVNSVTSVSLEPPLVLVCLEKNARSHDLVERAGAFALNILSDAQMELGKIFAYDRDARSAPLQHAQAAPGQAGALIFAGALGWLDCRIRAAYPGGDHTIFLAEVADAAIDGASSAPLIYFESRWLALHAAL